MLLLDLSQSKYAYSTSTQEMGSEYIFLIYQYWTKNV